MKLGFIIVNYNDSETTIKLINNIKNYEIIDKIVIVDNHSTDHSLKELKKYESSKIVVLENTSNLGYSSGINLGSRYLIEQFGTCNIIISNSDIEISSETVLKKMIKTMDQHTGIIAPVIKEHIGFNRGWKIPSPLIDCLLNIPFIHRYIRKKTILYKDSYYNQDVVEVEAVSGCFFMIDSNTLQQIDYFDENVFLYYEENILSKKIQKMHKKIKLITTEEVFHNHSVSIDKSINYVDKCKQQKKSQFYFQTKYNNASLLERILLKFTQFLALTSARIRNIVK